MLTYTKSEMVKNQRSLHSLTPSKLLEQHHPIVRLPLRIRLEADLLLALPEIKD